MKYKLLAILLCFVLGFTKSNAQSLSVQINSIESLPAMTTSSLPFQVESIANCLYIANGLVIYKPLPATSNNSTACSVPIEYDHYGLKIFPQPIGNSPRIQLTNSSNPNTLFSIKFYSIEGRLVLNTNKLGFELSQSAIINTSKLMPGNYVVQVVSENSIDVIQVIKQD